MMGAEESNEVHLARLEERDVADAEWRHAMGKKLDIALDGAVDHLDVANCSSCAVAHPTEQVPQQHAEPKRPSWVGQHYADALTSPAGPERLIGIVAAAK